MRRSFLKTLAAGASALAMPPLFAQAAKPLRLVVPFPAGGTADILPRVLADKLRGAYPAGVVVENRTGAGGNIGAEFVARSEPDGTTLLASPPGPIAINHHLYKTLAFDPTRWVPVTVIATVPNVLAVSNKLPVNTVGEFIAYVKANPGKVSYASQGNGSTSHLTAGMFMELTGTKMIHVPYKGTAPALVDIIGGQVDVFFDNIASSAPMHQGGKLRILAVADEHRSAALQQAPTFVEEKLPGMVSVTFFSLVAPPGTPAAVASAHQKAFAAALADPEVKRKFGEQGAEPCGWTPERTAQFIKSESDKWARVIRSANVTVE